MSQFSRTEMLIGTNAVEKLAESHVAVFGLGGVGSFVVEALARAGVGEISLVDFDVVDLTNLNRQLLALHSTVGCCKTEVAAARVLDVNPDVIVHAVNCRFDAKTADKFDFSKFDYVVDAVDTVTSKLLLAEICSKKSVPIISSMGTGNKLDPSAFRVADIFETSVCPLAKVMRRELKKRGITRLKVVYSKEEPLKPLIMENNAASDSSELQNNQICLYDMPKNKNINENDVSDSLENVAEMQSRAVKSHTKQTPASISFVPPVAGFILAGEVVKDLIK